MFKKPHLQSGVIIFHGQGWFVTNYLFVVAITSKQLEGWLKCCRIEVKYPGQNGKESLPNEILYIKSLMRGNFYNLCII